MALNKLTNCKVCGEQIAKNAKTCPKCGAKNKAKGSLVGVIAIIFIAIIIIAVASGNDEPVKVGDLNETSANQTSEIIENNTPPTETTAETKQEEKSTFAPGEVVALNDVIVTFVGVTESTGSTYNKPNEGNVFILCEFDIENKTSEELGISSMLSFDAYCDDYSCSISISGLIEKGNKNQLDGTVAPGKKMNGVVAYEVPADWQEIEISFTPNVWSGKDIKFVATK